MNNQNETHTKKITYLIEKHKKINDKSLLYLYRKELFDFVEVVPDNWSESKKILIFHRWPEPNDIESLAVENCLKYIHAIFFNEINKKLQINEKNSETTKIKFNDLNKTSSELWKSKVEDYVTEVEFLIRKILKSNVDGKRNLKITMILSNDFSNLLYNKPNNEFNHFIDFNNLLKKYDIQIINHAFLNKSNNFIFTLANMGYSEEKINLNLEKNIILLFITEKQNDFKFKIHNTIELKRYWEGIVNGYCIATKINFDTKMTNLSKTKIFAIKS